MTNKIAVVPTQSLTDERIADKIVDALDRNINVDVDDFDVIVENGTVTLTGTFPSWLRKRAAYNTARFTEGVVEVKDRINISLPE